MRISDWSSDVCSSDLYGHSLGGLFALHMLYTRPGAFRTIIAASPSIWWDNQAILAEERAWRTRVEQGAAPTRGTRLLLIAGEREEEGAIAEIGRAHV